jgi:hypothetical protein
VSRNRNCFPAVVSALALAGCATLPNGHGWGADATTSPGWARVGDAAVGALRSPEFWGPLVAATVLQVDGWDRAVSNSARTHTPVFGSRANAVTWSDRLRAASAYAYVATVLATPSGDDSGDWVLNKVRGTAVGLAAIGVTDEETALIKDLAARERPNGQGTQSMPRLTPHAPPFSPSWRCATCARSIWSREPAARST